ncbi:hypothetical protein JHK86_032024 [Glycine max]|nr:hypothetical protein JHK86_032024 [Glycine max]
MQTVCCFTGLNASNRLKTNWLIKTFSTKAHTSLLTHSAAHTKPFLSHSLGKREASTVCTRWVLHRRQRPVAEDRVPFALGVRIGQRSFSALRWDATAQPHTSETPPQSGLDFEFGGGIDELLCIPLISCSLKNLTKRMVRSGIAL